MPLKKKYPIILESVCLFLMLSLVKFLKGVQSLEIPMLSHGAWIIKLLISKVAACVELEGSRVWVWRYWKPLTKCSY